MEKSQNTKRIKILTKECTAKSGNKFLTFKAVQKDGKLIDCKFRKECTLPKANCFITVDKASMNIDKSKEYPTLWIKEIMKIENIEDVVSQLDDAKIDEMFE